MIKNPLERDNSPILEKLLYVVFIAGFKSNVIFDNHDEAWFNFAQEPALQKALRNFR